MTTPTPTDDELVAALRDLLIQLGIAMSAAGESVSVDGSKRQMVVLATGDVS